MVIFIIVLCGGLSTLCLAVLVRQNPRRRRAHRLPVAEPQLPAAVLLALACSPGVYLVLSDQWGGFVVWLSALSVLGWLVAAKAPQPKA